MLLVRAEYEIQEYKGYDEAIAHWKSLFEEGGTWHNLTKGWRIYTTLSNTKRVIVEMKFENFAEWESARNISYSGLTREDERVKRYFELFTEYESYSFWTLVAEG